MAKKTKSRIEAAIVSEERYADLAGLALARMRYRAKQDSGRRSRRVSSIEAAIVSEERYAELSRAAMQKMQRQSELRERRQSRFSKMLVSGAAAILVITVIAVACAIVGRNGVAVFS